MFLLVNVLNLFFKTFSAKEPLLLVRIDFTLDSTFNQGFDPEPH
jgi:hypothetical protein